MKYPVAVLIAAMLIFSACATPPALTATATALPPTPTPTETELPPPEPTGTLAPPSADAPLTAKGPWMVLKGDANLWVMNADGSGLREFDPGQVLRADGVSSADGKGALLAYITATGPYQTIDPWLRIISIPDLKELVHVRLVSDQTADTGDTSAANAPRNFQIGQAVTGSLTWSPDGTQLAFVGAMEGTSADVYTYTAQTGAITRFKGDRYQAADLVWTPDSKIIVNASISDFSWGGGHEYDSLWATRADGSGSTQVFDHDVMKDINGIIYQGWLANNLISFSRGIELKAANIQTGKLSDVSKDDIGAVNISPSGHILYGGSSYGEPGLYFLKSPADPPVKVSHGPVASIQWLDEAGLFMVGLGDNPQDNRLMLVDDSGAIKGTYTRAHHEWSMAPDATHWASYDRGSGMWVEDVNGSSRQITDDPSAALPSWSPDGMRLVWMGGDGWYTAQSPDYKVAPFAPIPMPEFPWAFYGQIIWLR